MSTVIEILNGVHNVMKTQWQGTAVLCLFIFGAATVSPLVHAIVGWLGAWWCYSTLCDGHGGKARYIVGFLCWTASFRAVNDALIDATIYCLNLGWLT